MTNLMSDDLHPSPPPPLPTGPLLFFHMMPLLERELGYMGDTDRHILLKEAGVVSRIGAWEALANKMVKQKL